MILFAEATDSMSQIVGILQSFGPAGVAAVALWWTSNRQDKRDKATAESNAVTQAAFVKLHDDAVEDGDVRFNAVMAMDARKMELLDRMVDKFGEAVGVLARLVERMDPAGGNAQPRRAGG